MTVRKPIEDFFKLCQESTSRLPAPEDRIAVSPATTKIAVAYERFRNTLEPDEEDILRRKSIWRILSRRIHEDRPELVTATALLQELVRARYIKVASRQQAQAIAYEIRRLRSVLTYIEPKLFDWFLNIVSVSIDQELYPRQKEEFLLHIMYHDLYPRVIWADDLIPPSDQPAQLFIACHRTLFANDDYEIAFHYFRYRFSFWKDYTASDEYLGHLAAQLPVFYQEMQQLLEHPGRQRMTILLRPMAVPYRIVWDIAQQEPKSIEAKDRDFAATVQRIIGKRVKQIQNRMSKRARHSVIFLLVTKIFLTFLIEFPYEYFLLHEIHWIALAANTVFHPTLLFVLGISVRMPGSKNTEKIVEYVETIVQGKELPEVTIRSSKRYGALTWTLFATLYTVLFIGIFWAMFSVLAKLEFSLPAMLLFVTFLGLVSFLASRVRRSADEIRVLSKRESILSIAFSFVALPILEFGSFLSRSIRQINILLFLMDRVLEAPFKLLIDVTEEWFAFVRERREEIG